MDMNTIEMVEYKVIDKSELIKFVNNCSWYQTIKFEDDVISKGSSWCVDRECAYTEYMRNKK